MKPEPADAAWLDERREFSFSELVQVSGLPESELRELVDYGALTPDEPRAAEWRFGGDVVATIRVAARLRDDLELEPRTLALVLTLIGRIHDLEAEMCALRARMPHRIA